MSKSNDEVYQEFQDNVNMSPSEIEDWLETDDSKSVGQDSGDGESKGTEVGQENY